MKKLLAVFHIEALLFLRDFYGFFFTFVFPLLMLLLYGSIYGNCLFYPTPSPREKEKTRMPSSFCKKKRTHSQSEQMYIHEHPPARRT